LMAGSGCDGTRVCALNQDSKRPKRCEAIGATTRPMKRGFAADSEWRGGVNGAASARMNASNGRPIGGRNDARGRGGVGKCKGVALRRGLFGAPLVCWWGGGWNWRGERIKRRRGGGKTKLREVLKFKFLRRRCSRFARRATLKRRQPYLLTKRKGNYKLFTRETK
jgi:hypothetical protein